MTHADVLRDAAATAFADATITLASRDSNNSKREALRAAVDAIAAFTIQLQNEQTIIAPRPPAP